jgi:hypothetical protein
MPSSRPSVLAACALAAAGALALASCQTTSDARNGGATAKGDEPAAGDQPPGEQAPPSGDRGTRCKAFVDATVARAFAATDDAFKAIVIDGAGGCETTPDRFHGLDAMLKDAGCTVNRITVSEEAAFKPPRGILIRAIDHWVCPASPTAVPGGPKRTVMVSSFGPIKDTMEIIAFDQVTQTESYYTSHRGASRQADFVYDGNSFVMVPRAVMRPLQQQGLAAAPHPCTSCHTNGTLVMKELVSPWMSWNPGGTPPARDVAALFAAIDIGGLDRQRLKAPAFETIVEEVGVAVQAERLRRIRAGVPFALPPDGGEGSERPYTLRDVMKPLFCETEVNLGTPGAPPEDDLFPLDPEVFVSADLRELLGASMVVEIDAGQWRKHFEDNGIGVPVAPADSDLRFSAMIVPKRSHNDVDWVRALIAQGVIERGVATAGLMVDFMNPVFSPRRCRLARVVPETPMSALADAAAVTAALKAAMAASTEPGAKEFLDNLGVSDDDFFARIEAAQAKCDAGGISRNAGHAYQLLRGRYQAMLNGGAFDDGLFAHAGRFAIEPPFATSIFPEGLALAAGDATDAIGTTLDPATCDLRP